MIQPVTSDRESALDADIARQRRYDPDYGSPRSRIGRVGTSSRDGAGVSDEADILPRHSRQVASEANVSPWDSR